MRKLVLGACVALGLATSPVMAAEDSGLYLGAGIGDSTIKSDRISFDDISFRFNDGDTAFKIFGGWRLNRYIGAELDYVDLGTASDRFRFDDGLDDITIKTDISVTAWVPYVVGTLPIGIFELSAKVGYAFWDADFKARASGIPSERDSESDEDFAYGFGAGVTLFDHLNAKLEYEVVDVSDADLEVWWITGAWRF